MDVHVRRLHPDEVRPTQKHAVPQLWQGGSWSANLTLRYLDETVVPGGQTKLLIPANGHSARFIQELFPDAETGAFTGTLTPRIAGVVGSGGRLVAGAAVPTHDIARLIASTTAVISSAGRLVADADDGVRSISRGAVRILGVSGSKDLLVADAAVPARDIARLIAGTTAVISSAGRPVADEDDDVRNINGLAAHAAVHASSDAAGIRRQARRTPVGCRGWASAVFDNHNPITSAFVVRDKYVLKTTQGGTSWEKWLSNS